VTGTRSWAVGRKWRHNRNGKYATLHKLNLASRKVGGPECFWGDFWQLKKPQLHALQGETSKCQDIMERAVTNARGISKKVAYPLFNLICSFSIQLMESERSCCTALAGRCNFFGS